MIDERPDRRRQAVDDDKGNTFRQEQGTSDDATHSEPNGEIGRATWRYHVSADDSDEDLSFELEQQARETIRVFRESAGDLGTRVRQALERASSLWKEVYPGPPGESTVTPEDELRGR